MQQTTNYNLNKFDSTDALESATRLGLNENADTIDTALKGIQDDIDGLDASEVSYDNTVSGLTATDVQGAIDEITDYSTTEVVIGKWIDGKPLYRKVVVYTGELANDVDTIVYDATSLSIDTIVKLDTMICFTNQSTGQPRTPNGRFASVTYSGGDKKVRYRQALTSHPSATDTLYITLEYTKTTD